jgi:cation diffusion facilitator family transporter
MNDQVKLFKKALLLEYFTVGYNFLEAIASLVAGFWAGSISLVGFGLDSIVESLSGFVLIWRLKKHNTLSEEDEERIEGRASRFVGITFLLLGIYVGFEAIRKIVLKEPPEKSLPGIIIAILSLIIMPILARAKMNIGRQLSLKSLIADAKETLACAWLSVALLIGLGIHALTGFWLADPIAGLIITGFLFREGFELVFEKEED